jgi:hypothetical protein
MFDVTCIMGRDSAVGIAMGCGVEVKFPEGAKYFSLLHRVQTGSGVDPASYQMSTGSLSGGKVSQA